MKYYPGPSRVVLYLLVKHGPMSTKRLHSFRTEFPQLGTYTYLKEKVLKNLWAQEKLEKKRVFVSTGDGAGPGGSDRRGREDAILASPFSLATGGTGGLGSSSNGSSSNSNPNNAAASTTPTSTADRGGTRRPEWLWQLNRAKLKRPEIYVNLPPTGIKGLEGDQQKNPILLAEFLHGNLTDQQRLAFTSKDNEETKQR